MCLAVPGRVVELKQTAGELALALVEFDGLRRSVCVELVPEARPGDFLLVHAGIALSRLDADEATRQLALLRAIGEMNPELEP